MGRNLYLSLVVEAKMQPQPSEFIAPKCLDEITLVHQDPDFIVINKPTKLLSLSGKNPLNKDSVHWRIIQQFPTATLIHRLDFGTSGLMLLALNKETNKLLCQQFSQRTVNKQYHAILNGKLSQTTGIIDYPIIKDVDNFPLQKACLETGKSAQSNYQVLSYDPHNDCSLVEFTPITGRTHQLRLHSLILGHPILGCDLYDDQNSFFKADRLMLHATYLQFRHPVTNQQMTFKSPSRF